MKGKADGERREHKRESQEAGARQLWSFHSCSAEGQREKEQVAPRAPIIQVSFPRKTQVCKSWKAGCCSYGASCKLAHPAKAAPVSNAATKKGAEDHGDGTKKSRGAARSKVRVSSAAHSVLLGDGTRCWLSQGGGRSTPDMYGAMPAVSRASVP